ncbi:MAG: SLC13 family permease, partial [Eubacteriales bacterium]
VALMVNYPGSKAQGKAIGRHSGPALMMASTLLTAGVFLGLLNESGMMDQMALMIAGIMPNAVAPYLHLIMGMLSAPIAMIFSTDSFFYGLLPVLIGVGEQFDVDPMQISITMLVAKNCVTLISPLVPAVYLGCGLAGVELKDLIKTSFFWLWGVSIICIIAGFAMGILTL